MSSLVKRIVVRLVILAIAGGILYGLSQVVFSSQPKHFRISHADVNVEVQPDASLHVTEDLQYEFTGDFSGVHVVFAGCRSGRPFTSATHTGGPK